MTMRERLNALDRRQQMIWVSLIWLLLFCVLWIWWDERTLPDISGRWASLDCETVESGDGVSYLKRFMENASGEWRLRVGFYEDAACAKELFSLAIEGPYDLGPKSMERLGATTARFHIRKTTLTPHAIETAAAFEKARCASGAWKVGEAQEVTQFGCLGIVPTVAQCPTEYDIVRIEDDELYLGDRSQGLCVPERYPSRFAPAPLRNLDSRKGQGI